MNFQLLPIDQYVIFKQAMRVPLARFRIVSELLFENGKLTSQEASNG